MEMNDYLRLKEDFQKQKCLSEVPSNIYNIKAALENCHHIHSNDCCHKKNSGGNPKRCQEENQNLSGQIQEQTHLSEVSNKQKIFLGISC